MTIRLKDFAYGYADQILHGQLRSALLAELKRLEKDITKATDFLKDFASKNGSSKKKNP